MKVIYVAAFILTLGIASCTPEDWRDSDDVGTVAGYAPVYAQPNDLATISVTNARATVKAGKIYVYGNYIFQNDINKGIHIIDNSNPANPHKVAFIDVPFSTELAIKNGFLYTNCVSDLVVLDLQNPQNPTLVRRLDDAFPVISQDYPPAQNSYFECVDPSKGIVVDWEPKTLNNPTCRR